MRGEWVFAFTLILAACKISEPEIPTPTGPLVTTPELTTTTTTITIPDGSSSNLTAPTIVSPAPGSDLDDTQPTLVVGNATSSDGSIPSYFFRVGSDFTLTDIAASADGVPQGSDGETSWKVTTPLEPGRYYWGAQARSGADFGPASPIVDFAIQGAVQPQPGGVLVSDPLTNFASVGQVSGGAFTAQGWQVTRKTDYIRYTVTPIENGFVEWSNTGFFPQNASPDQHILFGMWDPTRGGYRANPFRVHIQKLDTNHNPPYIRLRWIADEEQHDRGFDFLNWNPRQLYRWRIDWGPEGGENSVRVFLDGQLIILVNYRRPYLPEVHWIELGVAERQESVVGAVYSNFRAGSR